MKIIWVFLLSFEMAVFAQHDGKRISTIQGRGESSPFTGKVVSLRAGIVTMVREKGFFLQESEISSFSSGLNSRAIFIYTETRPRVENGDEVELEGVVKEYYRLTEIINPVHIRVKRKGCKLPKPVILPSKWRAGNFQLSFERFEGMRVSIVNGLICEGTDPYGGCLITTTGKRIFRQTTGSQPASALLKLLPPERMYLSATIQFSATGILTYEYGYFTLLAQSFKFSKAELPRPVRGIHEGEISLASQNCYNFFDTVDDPRRKDNILSAGDYRVKVTKLAKYFLNCLNSPTVIALQEVENEKILSDLVGKINKFDRNIKYKTFLIEGDGIRGIDTGFLVQKTLKTSNLKQIGAAAVMKFRGRSQPLFDRPPLQITCYPLKGPSSGLTIINVHNRSMIGMENDKSGRIARKRQLQVEYIDRYIRKLRKRNPKIHLLVTGDFNAFTFAVKPPLQNQVKALVPAERYSYVHQGIAQCLDNFYTTPALGKYVVEVMFSRGNADAAFQTRFKAGILGSSDHDGIVVYVRY